jgi:cell division septation protein DedD
MMASTRVARRRNGGKGAVIAAALLLAGCSQAFDADPIITSSAGSGAAQAAASGTLTPRVPGETLEERLARLEFDLAQLKLDYSIVRPSFEQLVEREEDLNQRIAAVEGALGPFTASVPSAPARSPTKLSPAGKPAKSAPAAKSRSSVSGEMGLHLASYRSLDRLKDGWSELKAKHPAELTGMSIRIQRIDTGKNGVFQRLIAGPVNSRTAADGLCRALSGKGVYCKPVGFSGKPL